MTLTVLTILGSSAARRPNRTRASASTLTISVIAVPFLAAGVCVIVT